MSHSLPVLTKSSRRPNSRAAKRQVINQIFQALFDHYDPQGWWPGESALEVVVGAVLTQNTAWANVERAMVRLKQARVLTLEKLHSLEERKLADLIRPSGTHRVKARRLKAVIDWFWARNAKDVVAALSGDLDGIRKELLSVHGVGPETADAILLYAGRRRTFVVDAYKRRIWRRHHILNGGEPYEAVRALAMKGLPPRLKIYQEYHALLIAVGKQHCRTRAQCEGCPLERLTHDPDL